MNDDLKRLAGQEAARMLRDGMRVGLGSGSTARAFVEALGRRVRDGLAITAVASSRQTAELACASGIKLVELDSPLDVAVDGADAVDRRTLATIKGLGGALVRERLVAQAALRFVLILDESKLFERLSDSQPAVPIPVEVLPFGWKLTHQRLSAFGNPILRLDRSGDPFVSDNGNLILDLYGCDYGALDSLAHQIKLVTGVVDHGLFLNLATTAIVASASGVTHIDVSGRVQDA